MTTAKQEVGELLAQQPLGDEDTSNVAKVGKLAKFLDFHIGEPVGNQVRNIAAVLAEVYSQRDRARGMVVELEGENAKLEQERDAALLAAERLTQPRYAHRINADEMKS